MNLDQQSNAREARRIACEDRVHARAVAREDKADAMVGELSSGKCYVWPVGGKYREGTRFDLVQFLVRNNYV